MNTEAMLAVADVIEHFNRLDMSVYTDWAGGDAEHDPTPSQLWENCGTVGCIGGWTAAWADAAPRDGDYLWLVRDEFDITFDQAGRLVYGHDGFWTTHGIGGPRTSKDAKKVATLLRRIAAGEIDL